MEIHKDEENIKEQLEQYGLKPDSDFYLEPIYEVTSHIEAVSHVIVSENNYEKGDYDIYKNADFHNVLHDEKRKIGFQILDKEFKPIKMADLTKNRKTLPIPKLGKNQCGICGKKVIRNKQYCDNREIDGEIRCFDHIGIEKERDLI